MPQTFHPLTRVFAFLCLLGLLITWGMVSKNKFLQFSEHAKSGILSLEFTGDKTEQYKIFHEWRTSKDSVFVRDYKKEQQEEGSYINGLSVTFTQTQADYYFAVFYSLSLILLYSYYKTRGKLSVSQLWTLILLTILICGFDFKENDNILSSIQAYPKNLGQAPAVKTFAILKFSTLLLSLALFIYWTKFWLIIRDLLLKASSNLSFIIHWGWTFRIVLIFLFVFYALLNFSDQGQDLIVTINTSPFGTLLFLTSISILAALNWYLPKLYTNQTNDLSMVVSRQTNVGQGKEKPMDYARILGVITFLIPAIGILKTLQQYHMPFLLDGIPTIILLIASIFLFAEILNKPLLNPIYLRAGKINLTAYLLTCFTALALMTGFFFTGSKTTPPSLSFLAADLFILAFIFYLTVLYRTDFPPLSKKTSTIRNSIAKSLLARIIVLSGILASLFFILFNIKSILFSLTDYDRFFTLSIVVCALVSYTMIFSFLLVLGRKIKFQLITFLLLITISISYFKVSDFHKVHTVNAKREKLEALRSYIRRWLDDRRPEIESYKLKHDTLYPVYFVNSYGGGIRASAWATSVVGALDEYTLKINRGNTLKEDFQHHVFSYSGASGGTIGFSLLIAGRKNHNKPDTTFAPSKGLNLYKQDYLSANVVGMFGRDLLMSAIGRNDYPDRSRLQEMAFERTLARKYAIDYSSQLQSIYDSTSSEIPMLFSNTYDINTAKKAIVSPLYLDANDFPACIFIQDLMAKNKQDLPLSAAAFLSARFPYVCPTGKFNEKNHFTDGGTIENSGGETSLQIIRVFESVMSEEAYRDLSPKITRNILSISSDIPSIDNPRPEKNLYEIFAPAIGILGTINGNAVKADAVNEVTACAQGYNYFRIRPSAIKIDKSWPVLPLGWQISDNALKGMALSVKAQDEKFKYILETLHKTRSKDKSGCIIQ